MKNNYLIAIKAAVEAGKAIKEIYHSEYEIEIKKDLSPLTIADKKSHEIIQEDLTGLGYPILSEEGKTIEYNQRVKWEEFWIVDPLDGTKEFINKNGEFTVNIAWIKNGKPIFGVIFAPIPGILYYGIIGEGAFRIEEADKKLTCINHKNLRLISEPLPIANSQEALRIVSSKSHGNDETKLFIDFVKKETHKVELASRGSSLKLCLIAEGTANLYPRFGPTCEWDIAAGHAIINASGGKVLNVSHLEKELAYNKPNLLNPHFIAISGSCNSNIIEKWSTKFDK